MAAAARKAPSSASDELSMLPAALADRFERTVSDAPDKSLPLLQALAEVKLLAECLTADDDNAKQNNVRYVAEPFTDDKPQPMRVDRGDFEMTFMLPGFFGSTFEAILERCKSAHRIYVHLAGLRVTIRVHRLPYWTQACNIIAGVANDAEKRSVRFLPYQALSDAIAEDEEAYAELRTLEPEFKFTPADLEASAPMQGGDVSLSTYLLARFFPSAAVCRNGVAFWAIGATPNGESAQIKVWVLRKEPEAAVKKEKPLEVVATMSAVASLINNKKQRTADMNM
jgi:hypothetical protein